MNISLKSQIERAPRLHRVRAISSKELSWSLPIILSSFYSCSFSLWPNKMPADMENHFWYTIHTKKAFVPQSSTKIKRPKLLRSVKCNFFFASVSIHNSVDAEQFNGGPFMNLMNFLSIVIIWCRIYVGDCFRISVWCWNYHHPSKRMLIVSKHKSNRTTPGIHAKVIKIDHLFARSIGKQMENFLKHLVIIIKSCLASYR